MIDKKEITERMLEDRAFIIAAVSCDLIELIKEEHEDWLDNYGYQPYYDLVVELVDYMLFTENSVYLKYMKKKEKDENLCFSTHANDCFDWFHMKLARSLVTKDLLHAVCFGGTEKYFESIEQEKKDKKSSVKQKRVKQVIPPEQVKLIIRALNLLEKALSEQCQEEHSDVLAYTTFDIITLKGLLSGEVSVVHLKEIAETFSHHHNVDWPDYGDKFPREDI